MILPVDYLLGVLRAESFSLVSPTKPRKTTVLTAGRGFDPCFIVARAKFNDSLCP